MFNGTFSGNLMGFLYFTLFIISGIFITNNLFKKLSFLTRLWLGTVTGTVLLMWLPVAVSFIIGFNIASHIIALVLLLGLDVLSIFLAKKPNLESFDFSFSKDDLLTLIPVVLMTVFYGIVEASHIMQPSESGGFIFGQSTYADVHIHLSFITSPIKQGTVPFYYNIAPQNQVSYPFLSDTVSSSIYIFGASLRWSYIVPTIMGAFNIYLGALMFFRLWLKKFSKALIAWILFAFNGGFGFMYFFDNLKISEDNFTRIFEKLYETPTNLDGNMIRWVNTFCDMMIPQRATLFGWMMLFAILYLLYRAVFLKENDKYIYAGILAGLTPLISTHIFLAVGIISAVWMLSRLYIMAKLKPKYAFYIALTIFLLGAVIFTATCIKTGDSITNVDYDTAGMNVLLSCGIIIAIIYAGLLLLNLLNGKFKEIFSTWGIYLIIVLVLALPQLIKFTFGQAQGEGFLQPHFNWINSKDSYFWFYVKNMGVPALLILPALFNASKRNLSVVAPVAVLMLLAETFSLQPNVYDNNKIIYPAFFLAIGVIADYMVTIYQKLKGIKGREILAVGVIIACMLSGALSMGREYVADEYEMFSSSQVQVAAWVDENTEDDAVFLTNDRYNNAITGLTGRSVVCGGGWFFSTHGLPNHSQLQNDVRQMYADPENSKVLFEKHSVDYIVVGPDETGSYTVNEDAIKNIADMVYNENGIQVYKLK